jgi:hypothetical protein
MTGCPRNASSRFALELAAAGCSGPAGSADTKAAGVTDNSCATTGDAGQFAAGTGAQCRGRERCLGGGIRSRGRRQMQSRAPSRQASRDYGTGRDQ